MEFSDAELGPKMQACSERERKFVWAFLQNGGKDASSAARQAGYPDTGSGGIRVRAHALMHRERVLAALDEVGRKAFRGLLIPAVVAAEALLDEPKHADHVKAVFGVLSRNGLGEKSGLDVNISGEVTLNHTDSAVEDLRRLKELGMPRERLLVIFGLTGLDRYERMLATVTARERPAIAADYKEVEDERP